MTEPILTAAASPLANGEEGVPESDQSMSDFVRLWSAEKLRCVGATPHPTCSRVRNRLVLP